MLYSSLIILSDVYYMISINNITYFFFCFEKIDHHNEETKSHSPNRHRFIGECVYSYCLIIGSIETEHTRSKKWKHTSHKNPSVNLDYRENVPRSPNAVASIIKSRFLGTYLIIIPLDKSRVVELCVFCVTICWIKMKWNYMKYKLYIRRTISVSSSRENESRCAISKCVTRRTVSR